MAAASPELPRPVKPWRLWEGHRLKKTPGEETHCVCWAGEGIKARSVGSPSSLPSPPPPLHAGPPLAGPLQTGTANQIFCRTAFLSCPRPSWQEFKGKCFKCGKTGHMSKDCRCKRSEGTRSQRDGLAETGCIDTVSIDLNTLEIGAVQLPEGRP